MLADSFVVPNEISEINARPRQQLRLLATEAEEVLSSLDFIFLAGELAAGKALH